MFFKILLFKIGAKLRKSEGRPGTPKTNVLVILIRDKDEGHEYGHTCMPYLVIKYLRMHW